MAVNNVIMSHQFRVEGYELTVWMRCIQTTIQERIEFQGFSHSVVEELELERDTEQPLYIEVTDLTGEVVQEGLFDDVPAEWLEILPQHWESEFLEQAEECLNWPV